MYNSMKMEIVSEKFKYEKPQIDEIKVNMSENVCAASVVNPAIGSHWGESHQHVDRYDSDNPDTGKVWGGDTW